MNGILGGDTTDYNAYVQQLQRLEMEKQKFIAEEQMRYNQAMNTAQNSVLGQKYATHQGLGVQASRARTPIPRFNPNDSEAFQIPMSQLVTMWRLKYGDSWHDGQQTSSGLMKDFYEAAFERLNRAQLFESFEGWYRLKEDA
jgi:hypothetical protein